MFTSSTCLKIFHCIVQLQNLILRASCCQAELAIAKRSFQALFIIRIEKEKLYCVPHNKSRIQNGLNKEGITTFLYSNKYKNIRETLDMLSQNLFFHI